MKIEPLIAATSGVSAAKRIAYLFLLAACDVQDEADEQERADCESFFVAANECVEALVADSPVTELVLIPGCLYDAGWPQNERAEIYAEQLDDDCDLFALRRQGFCADEIDEIDDIDGAGARLDYEAMVQQQLYAACVAVYLDVDFPLDASIEECVVDALASDSRPEFTFPPAQLCETP